MIKKLHTIVCALTLITALPTLSMENDPNLVKHAKFLCSDHEENIKLWHELTAINIDEWMGKYIYQCDNCHQEKSTLSYDEFWYHTVKCIHILCSDCKIDIHTWQKPIEDTSYLPCHRCSYFLHQHNKQCWHDNNVRKGKGALSILPCPTSTIRLNYHRTLPDITESTVFPTNPNDISESSEKNSIAPSFYTINNLKRVGRLAIISALCYAAYKAYTSA